MEITHLPIQCFRCGQLGHRVAECLAPTSRGEIGSPGPWKARKTPKKTPKKSRAAHQAVEALQPLPDEGEAPGEEEHPLLPYDSEEEGEQDPMVSAPIHPFVILVTIMAPK